MELNAVHHQIVAPVIQESIRALKDMAHSDAWAGNEFQDNIWKFRFNGFAIAVVIRGDFTGTILIHHYLETALALGRRVLGASTESIALNDKLTEALLDYGNTVIGEATRELQSLGLILEFKPPYCISNGDNMPELLRNVDEIISIPIHAHTVGRHYLNFLSKENSGVN